MKNIAIFISAWNEEKVIGNTLNKLIDIIDPADIYIASDGSTDKTASVVKKFNVNFVHNRSNTGKVTNTKKGIKKYNLLNKYEYLLILDADTIPHQDFIPNALARFKDNVACVCGMVEAHQDTNIFVAYRTFLYIVWQQIYKRIYSIFNAVTIAPGTASIYRTSVFKEIEFDKNIIIEDFDLTFQVHRKKLGKIVFEPKAKVVTQDPDNLKDTYKQMARWQLGFWQTAYKHKVPLGFQAFDAAIIITVIQMVIYTLFLFRMMFLTIWIGLFAFYPSFFGNYVNIIILVRIIMFDIAFVWVFSSIVFIASKKYNQIIYGPILWCVQFVYVASMFKSIYLAIFRSISGAWVTPTRR